MQKPDSAILRPYAKKYVWWKTPDQALKTPERIVAQVMDIGDYDDIQALAQTLGDDYLRYVITHSDAGVFSDRSWTYWHYRLGLSGPGQVPPLPKRRVA